MQVEATHVVQYEHYGISRRYYCDSYYDAMALVDALSHSQTDWDLIRVQDLATHQVLQTLRNAR